MNPKYTIYIPSKGRLKSRQTIKALEKMNTPYYVVIESHEYKGYKKVISSKKIIVLPWSKPNSSTEIVKTRNWIKEYSISKGEKRHWQIDDNILTFFRYNRNLTVPVTSGTIFRCAEDFTDRYTNIAISGFQYFMFIVVKSKMRPYYLNSRVYSISLINNSIPHKWRDIYNEDTDICIRVLKDGWCTVLFNAFVARKAVTMSVKGGNTDMYKGDGRLKMAESLHKQHPDVTRISQKFGRWQHHVNYKPFRKNKLIKKKGLITLQGVNNYGMKLITIKEE